MSLSRLYPKVESRGTSHPSEPNFGIHGSSAMRRSKVDALAWKAVTSFSYSVGYGNSTSSTFTPTSRSHIGRIAFSPLVSPPATTAIVSLAGFGGSPAPSIAVEVNSRTPSTTTASFAQPVFMRSPPQDASRLLLRVLRRVLLGDQDRSRVDPLGHALLGQGPQRVLDPELPHVVWALRNTRRHRAAEDGLRRFGNSIKPHDQHLAGLPAGLHRLGRAQRPEVIRRADTLHGGPGREGVFPCLLS